VLPTSTCWDDSNMGARIHGELIGATEEADRAELRTGALRGFRHPTLACSKGRRGAERERHCAFDDDDAVHAREAAELADTAPQPLYSRLDLDDVPWPNWSVVPNTLDPHEEREPFAVFRLGKDQDSSNLCNRFRENGRRQRRQLSWLTRQIPLVQGDILDADDALVGLELGDAVDEQEWVTVRENPLDGGVVERKRKFGHGKAFSIIRPASMNVQPPVRPPSDTELLSTLFDLGREVMSVLELEELLAKIPQLIARLTRFNAFSVYLLDEAQQELRIAYAVGYPEGALATQRLRVGQGVVGAAVEEGRPILVNDIRREPRYLGPLRNMFSQLAVPMRRKGRVIGALNLLSETTDAFSSQDEALLRQFAAHVAVAIENARLFRAERQYVDTLETLAEIGREMSSILDLDVLLRRIASLTKRLIDYRTFGILLLDEATEELDMKMAVRYGDEATEKRVKLGQGLVGWAALHKQPILVPDVSKDARYINLVPDARSELVIPMLIKDRCIGVFDLESPELNAFTKEHMELLTLLASQAAVAIENARLYEEVRRNEERIEKELRFAQRVQLALLPTEPPVGLRDADVAGRFEPARELGGDLHDFLSPDQDTLAVAVGDVSGKGAPAALYGAFAAELVRSRTLRRRYAPDRFSVSGVLQSMNTILHERQLEEYYCTLCYAFFDFQRRVLTMSNSGMPYPIRCSGTECGQIELPGVPLGSFAGVVYDEITLPLQRGDLFVFCTDGILETVNEEGEDFGARRICEIVKRHRDATARDIVDAIFKEAGEFRGRAPQHDDMTAVAVKITT